MITHITVVVIYKHRKRTNVYHTCTTSVIIGAFESLRHHKKIYFNVGFIVYVTYLYRDKRGSKYMCMFFSRKGASPRRKKQCHLTLKIICLCKYWSNKEATNFFSTFFYINKTSLRFYQPQQT